MDDKKSCLEQLEKYKVIKKGGAWKSWAELLDEKLFEELGIDITAKFQIAQWRTWMENKDFYQAISRKIAECSISKYKGYMDSDNVVIETEDGSPEFDNDLLDDEVE